jgi:hypothetical protein
MADDSLGTRISSVVFSQGLGGTQKADSFLDIPSPFRAPIDGPLGEGAQRVQGGAARQGQVAPLSAMGAGLMHPARNTLFARAFRPYWNPRGVDMLVMRVPR